MEKSTTEVPTTEEVEIIHCDACGREADGDFIMLPIARKHWDDECQRFGDKLHIDGKHTREPIYVCQECENEGTTEIARDIRIPIIRVPPGVVLLILLVLFGVFAALVMP